VCLRGGRTATSEVITWTSAAEAAEADAVLYTHECGRGCEMRHLRIWAEPGALHVDPGLHDEPPLPSGLRAQLSLLSLDL
jgi:hypothetical protein